MAATQQTYYDAILLDVVLRAMIKREENWSPFAKRLQRNNRDIMGDYIVGKMQIAGEEGFGARGRGGIYPTSSEGGFLDIKIALKRNYGSIECYGEDRFLGRGKPEEAVTNIIAHKAASFIENFALDMQRQYWGNGSGELAKVAADDTAVNTITVNKVQHLRRGMIIDIHEGAVIENRKITARSPKNKTITFDGAAANVTSGSIITRADAKDLEMVGLQQIVDDGVTYNEFQNIERQTFEEWASLLVDGEGNAFDLNLFDEMICKQIYDYGSRPSGLFFDSKTLLSIVYLAGKKKMDLTPVKIQLGFEVPSYTTPVGNLPMIVDPEVPEFSSWSFQEDTLELRRPGTPMWIPGIIGGYWMPHPDKDMDYAHMRYLCEMFCLQPWKNARYDNYVSAVGT